MLSYKKNKTLKGNNMLLFNNNIKGHANEKWLNKYYTHSRSQ